MFQDIDSSGSAVLNDTAVKAEASNDTNVDKANSGKKNEEPQIVATSKIMEVGGHIGLSKRRWNPKMRPYIYTKRGHSTNALYDVLNLPLVHEKLKEAFAFLTEVAKNKGVILFVGTKNKQIQELVKEIAKRVEINYIYQRWLGGTLTNFKTINNSIRQLNKLTEKRDAGLNEYTKKEQVLINKKVNKLEKFFGGIKTMRGLPNVIVVDDPVHEKNAIIEARKLNIPIVAIANTNANPDLIDYIIPANNASIRSVTLYMNLLADAVAIGQGKPPLFAYKPDEEIVIAQTPKRDRFDNRRNVVNRSHNFQEIQNRRREQGAEASKTPETPATDK